MNKRKESEVFLKFPKAAQIHLRQNSGIQKKEVYKNKKFRILAEFYVGVDGFEPPTLCL